MRLTLLGALLGIGGHAWATFDLMLLGDNTDPNNPRVVRYDPVNRIVLGSFGQAYLDNAVVGITADIATGRAFVNLEDGRTRVFDYSTGALLNDYLGSPLFNDVRFDASSGLVAHANGSGSGTTPGRAYNPTTGVAQLAFASTFISTAPIRRPGATWWMSWGFASTGTNLTAYQFAAGGGNPTASISAGVLQSGTNSFRGNVFSNSSFYGIRTTGTQAEVYSVLADANGIFGSPTLQETIVSTATNVNIVNGHGNMVYLLNGSQLHSFSTSSNRIMGTSNLTFATAANIQGMAIVLAPEPGTMLALGAGVAVLLRRRKK